MEKASNRLTGREEMTGGGRQEEEKHLLKVADGRVESPERDVNKVKWEMIQLLPYILNGGRDRSKQILLSVWTCPDLLVTPCFINLPPGQSRRMLPACPLDLFGLIARLRSILIQIGGTQLPQATDSSSDSSCFSPVVSKTEGVS
ncbi:hypothetical protein NQZ68_038297 [Dissostichus eleginoides]|nr:hypothetical protein NQZ68_038297 [Dissostichus eleginoides]